MKYYVYVLKCPVINQVRYVGATKNPYFRRGAHCSKRFGTNYKNKKEIWLKELVKAGLEPEFEIVFEADTIEGASRLELAIYNELLPLGFLTNYDVSKSRYRVNKRKPRPPAEPIPTTPEEIYKARQQKLESDLAQSLKSMGSAKFLKDLMATE